MKLMQLVSTVCNLFRAAPEVPRDNIGKLPYDERFELYQARAAARRAKTRATKPKGEKYP